MSPRPSGSRARWRRRSRTASREWALGGRHQLSALGLAFITAADMSDGAVGSTDERLFHTWAVDTVRSTDGGWSIAAQVLLSALSRQAGNDILERVDFLLTHPIGVPLVVEIDGSGHESHSGRHAARDDVPLLEGFGYLLVHARCIPRCFRSSKSQVYIAGL